MSVPLPAYQRILRAGYDLEIVRADNAYLLHIIGGGGKRLFTDQAPRIGRLTIQQVRDKCWTGTWRSDARMLLVLNRLADLCESMTEAGDA